MKETNNTNGTNDTNKSSWKFDYNPEGNRNDRIVRKLMAQELVNENIIGVLDVGDNSLFFAPDIDLLLVNKYYHIATAELKADNYDVGFDGKKRIYLEYISNNNKYLTSMGKEGIGNVLTSQSTYFIYYFIKTQSYLLMETKKLAEWVRQNVGVGKYQIKSAQTKGYLKDQVLFISYGLVVPINVLMDEIGAKHIPSRINFYEFANTLEDSSNQN